ncbi:MAG: prolyl oligopeptidase family serine peptidase [Clostridia bacterium]|nr:prolyl oligopeptidase family serine peptidase [Clostridia bacterium]
MEKHLFSAPNGQFDIGYYVFLPKDYSYEKKYPMVVFLHGAGERGDGKDQLDKIKNHALPRYASEGKEYPAILLCPQCPRRIVWNNVVFELKALIDKVAAEYNADMSRISITGISMGGFGTWEMGLTFPNFFSAIAPVCGGGLSWRCENLKGMPIWAFHGDADNIVPPKNSLEMVDSVNAKGGNAKLTIFHGVGHDSWVNAYEETNVFEWLISNVRENFNQIKEAFDEF